MSYILIYSQNPTYLLLRLGYSKKGWTDNALRLEFVKDFDKQTRDIAAGRTWALYIDGHNSHVSFEFLEYC